MQKSGKKSEMYTMVNRELCKMKSKTKCKCVAVEDTRTGMQAALDGRVPCVLLCKGKFTEKVTAFIKALVMPNMRMKEPCIVGIDFGGLHTTVGFGDILWLCFDFSFKEETHENILDFLKDMCGLCRVKALGVALACTIVPTEDMKERRISEHSTKFSKLSKVKKGYISEIEKLWKRELGGIRVAILNDGEAAAIAEHKEGAGREYDNILVITLGTSIGAGFIFHGEPHIGKYTSRASHIILDPCEEWCRGENHKGCWKVLAGSDALKKLAENMGFQKNSKEIAKKAQRGDRKSKLFYEFYAEKVAMGIASIVGAVPVECVITGGGIAQAGNILFNPLRARLKKGDLLDYSVASVLEIVPAECEEPVVRGAQLYVG